MNTILKHLLPWLVVAAILHSAAKMTEASSEKLESIRQQCQLQKGK